MAVTWRAFAGWFGGAAAAILSGYLLLAFLVDPYDSGRSPVSTGVGVRPQGPRTAVASRGRDTAFAGAVIGNSHIQLVSPERLGEATGIPFVQLSVPATSPAEQFAILAWYLRHHPQPEAIVIAPDEYWCTDDPALPNPKSFPFWLLSDSATAYLRGLLRFSVAQEVVNRLGRALARDPARAPPDGWSDYEPEYLGLAAGDARQAAAQAAQRDTPAPQTPDPGRAGPGFPAAERFAHLAGGLPARTALVVVFPPIAPAALARPGTARHAAEAACKAAIAAAARVHPRTAVLDWRRPRPDLDDPSQFFDAGHYRHPVARRLADAVGAEIRRLVARKEGGGPPAQP
ncbi:hypothetical protein ASG40_11790 [Methylobacterium sp. Leaf399]|uniref:hypothetical protein n=1 Tax=Methylobacterium sp. Leaf466 TaxID=1736386 RepID=UPI00070144AF|nr:hypothetical protein [Methylobacterium sp. Leaf466]KQT08550.1 hypothetical protein ASG40_11790 [Methylobacterium sp. Leaf399]KQT81879.1 hypothetical protein ASG59_19090 [Methylobacterium sp. Leaf466]